MKKIIVSFSLLFSGIAINAQIADSLKRVVKMEGAYNFRDVGGYKTVDGKEVVLGKIYRSDAINKLTDKDLQNFKNRNIKSVIDFRGIAESKQAPDKLPINTKYILSPAGSNFIGTGKDAEDMRKAIVNKDFLYEMYGEKGLPYFGERFRPLFENLLALPQDEALLFHCTGGRDRTGMASALFLTLLGVPKETVTADYVASNFYLSKSPSLNQGMSQMAKMAGVSKDRLEDALKLTPELLDAFFNSIKSKYGSIENFFQVEMGIGPKEVSILKQKYLK